MAFSAARGDERIAPNAADAPLVTSARARLLDHLRLIRPDIQRFELTAIGAPATLHAVGMQAGAVHGNVLTHRTCVWVGVGHDNHSTGSVPVWFDVKALRSVLVSQHKLTARTAVGGGDFAVAERDVARLDGVPLGIDTDVTRMRARHVIATDQVILKSDLEALPEILRGQDVAVEVKQGAVAIETRAVALREARFGESVTLQNPDSHLTYAARVVGEGRAVVIE
jgi:flagella basal body P-ring formation protein FlgA